MALVKYGAGIIQMSGSIAGNTFARNRYGNYVRSRTKPINPNSAAQIQVRSALSECTNRWWNVLDAAKRDAWNTYGDQVPMQNRLGEVVRLTGFNQYVRSNSLLIRAFMTPVDDGPALFNLPNRDNSFSITASEATQVITVGFNASADWATEPNAYMFIFDGQPQNAQRNFFKGPWRYSARLTGDPPSVSPLDHTSIFTIAEGQRLWCYGRIIRADGRLSDDFAASTFCAA